MFLEYFLGYYHKCVLFRKSVSFPSLPSSLGYLLLIPPLSYSPLGQIYYLLLGMPFRNVLEINHVWQTFSIKKKWFKNEYFTNILRWLIYNDYDDYMITWLHHYRITMIKWLHDYMITGLRWLRWWWRISRFPSAFYLKI